jgi:hypothetical protein
MTTKGDLPLLLQFGQRIETPSALESRHDPARQMMQVKVGEVWVDAIDAHQRPGTRTDVKHESTDED